MQRVNVLGTNRTADLMRADGVQAVRQTLRELDDGRHRSFTVDPYWRKNHRPAPPGRKGDGTCTGADLNRNFEFMWDFATAFSPAAAAACSTHPRDKDVYIGPAHPETTKIIAELTSGRLASCGEALRINASRAPRGATRQ